MTAAWQAFPTPVVDELLRHYTRIECHIALEMELAGLVLADTDFDDETWNRWYSFYTRRERELFLSMVAFENHPSGERWRLCKADKMWHVEIPRNDLFIVHRNLKRLNAIMVDEYEVKKRRAIERTGWVDA